MSAFDLSLAGATMGGRSLGAVTAAPTEVTGPFHDDRDPHFPWAVVVKRDHKIAVERLKTEEEAQACADQAREAMG